MNTQTDNSSDLAKELAARLADSDLAREKLETSNAILQEEIERKNKTLEGFIAENEALKEELGGEAAVPGKTDIGRDKAVSPPQKGRRAERLTRALLEAARGRVKHGRVGRSS
jgi:hypothetical protein